MKKIISLLFLLITVLSCYAQDDVPPPRSHPRFVDRLVTGGTIGLQFGTYTAIEIAPILGYRVTDRFMPGIGIKYMYFKDTNYDYSTDIYGGSVFARYLLLESLFAHVEYEVLNMDVPSIYGTPIRENITSVFVGGGYMQMIGSNSSFNFLVLFNVNETAYSPYQNPIFRLGFGIGL